MARSSCRYGGEAPDNGNCTIPVPMDYWQVITEGTISPTTYGFAQVDVEPMVMLAFGGIGSLFGPVLGAAVFTVIDELIQGLGQLRLLVYGALIIALFLWVPRGIIPTLGDLMRRRQE